VRWFPDRALRERGGRAVRQPGQARPGQPAVCLASAGMSRVVAANKSGCAVWQLDTNPGLSACESAVARVCVSE
jgi:hypothetical protein